MELKLDTKIPEGGMQLPQWRETLHLYIYIMIILYMTNYKREETDAHATFSSDIGGNSQGFSGGSHANKQTNKQTNFTGGTSARLYLS